VGSQAAHQPTTRQAATYSRLALNWIPVRAARIKAPNHQIRSLVLSVDLVGFRRIWPAQVGWAVGHALPASLVGRRQPGAPPVPQAVADRYAIEVQALAASLTVPAGQDPTVLTLDAAAGELLLGFEGELEPRLVAGTGDLAPLAGWAAKLAGATCRLAALLHLASRLRDGWAQPVGADTLAGAVRLAGYLVEHARAVFDLMGADSRTDDARWLLDWTARTGRAQFSRRDAHAAAPRGRFPKATDLEPALRLLEEHGYLRRVDPEPSRDPHGRGRPPSPRFLVNPL
jgi:replicative DNA helicase